MLLLILAAIFIEALLLSLLLYNFLFKGRREIEQRVAEVVSRRTTTVREQELRVPFYRRAVKPILLKMSLWMIKALPIEKETQLGRKLVKANLNEAIEPRELLVIKYLAGIAGAALLWMLGDMLGKGFMQAMVLSAAGLGLGWYMPDFYINSKGLNRMREIEKSLPDVLDLLTVSVEAGLGFDGALMKVVEKTKSALSQEFTLMLKEIKMGKPRIEAMRDMSNRVDVDDLSTFTGSVIMADQLGVSIGNILRLQSEQIRQRRRQRVEEMAMKAPVKMLVPMVLFIFPAIFVVLLGPAALKIANAF
ncbi:Bacterial type II secretion system protein F domain protein [Pelotomaculum schinkii]|uniref:Bacterial type II secretion system protein F domain protein n=1 Tax=Pelotomaculum schinkii TaxID=78350 RepID=A0A4Y7RE68_9FIRM|nr:type II secretion system F family protein [Pelotomaculum schinkii]TEB06992.1 Bacterial type II secretion system protein F domain protein [Pelotomaculum schinkii]